MHSWYRAEKSSKNGFCSCLQVHLWPKDSFTLWQESFLVHKNIKMKNWKHFQRFVYNFNQYQLLVYIFICLFTFSAVCLLFSCLFTFFNISCFYTSVVWLPKSAVCLLFLFVYFSATCLHFYQYQLLITKISY